MLIFSLHEHEVHENEVTQVNLVLILGLSLAIQHETKVHKINNFIKII